MSPILVLTILSILFQINIAQDDVDPPVDDAVPDPVTEPESNPTPPPEDPAAPAPELSDSEKFIVPETIEDGVDSFKYDNVEYLFVNTRMRHRFGDLLCSKYNARLATVKTEALGNFLAEALSETNLLLDTLWIGGTMETDQWIWRADSNESDPITGSIVDMMVFSENIGKDIAKDCLGFARSDHDKPEFRPINCGASRSLICERPFIGDAGSGNSTHTHWIRVGRRDYKIFREHVDYNTARMKCGQFEIGTDLAVITNMKTIEILSRYLLIGRPSLENAWIQAKYVDDQFMYPGEPEVLLSNSTDSDTGFPPWRNGAIQKPSGCVLLDRHLADKSLFVEARCQRLRPYICYRKVPAEINGTPGPQTTDAIIKDNGYRLIYNPLPWDDACDSCKDLYKEYGAILVEPSTEELVKDITFFMGEYKISVGHVWIGGKMEGGKWTWDSNDAPVDEALLTTYGVTNTSYSEDAEVLNVCLNFDRENHNVALIYGTLCSYPQSYICMFEKEKLVELKEKEKEEQENNQVI